MTASGDQERSDGGATRRSVRRTDLLDLDRLTPEERELWDEPGPTDGSAIDIWSFGYVCMLELGHVPAVVSECLKKLDPDNRILEYLENVRRARGG